MSQINFEADLNGEQLAAVQAGDGPVLVIAAAGTGKTRALTYRVAYLVEQNIDPARILLLTFTNRAAREMLERAQGLVGERVGGLWGGTFHHMANRILRRHSAALGYDTDYTILDQDDSRSLVKAVTQELNLSGKHFPKPDVLLSIFGLASSTNTDVLEIAHERFEHHPINIEDIERVWRSYSAKKLELNAMDFDDLLLNGLRLFREHDELCELYQDRFRYTLVDEYQDTNCIQAEWVDLVAARHRNLLVVGDDFQSIYSWRGADYRNILEFPDRYPDCQVYKLETNYRSVPEILELANASIAANPEQFQKHLRSVRDLYKKPALVKLRDGDSQARFVIERFRALKRDGYRPKDMVVLYRSHFQALELQLELARAGIPYAITSGVRFFEQAHIKDVSSLLRLLENPADELAFLRLLCLLPRIGQRTAVKLWNKLGNHFDPEEQGQLKILRESIPVPAREPWSEIETICVSYRKEGLDKKPGETVSRFMEAFYDVYAVETFDNYVRRVEDIQALILYTEQFNSTAGFLSEVALLTNLDAEADRVGNGDDEALRLSTVHQAKGLEWSVVFLLWLADGMFPSGRSLSEGSGESEERRLFYVAVTRAKDELYLCCPELRRARDGSTTYYSTSRFVKELPEDLLDQANFFL
ncbi:MAG: ATP-dependent helicase [Verrucomicrobia bacterium]|nr:ATP-dependent helicase [Verrucomicrobiota bacterium]